MSGTTVLHRRADSYDLALRAITEASTIALAAITPRPLWQRRSKRDYMVALSCMVDLNDLAMSVFRREVTNGNAASRRANGAGYASRESRAFGTDPAGASE